MELNTDQKKESYAFGIDVGQQLGQFKEFIDNEAFFTGLQTVFTDGEPKISPDEFKELMQSFQAKQASRQKEQQEASGGDNTKEGEEFLAKNKDEEGVIVTDSGLQYKVLSSSEGEKPVATDKVNVHYEGKLLSGQVFDSSYQRGEPISFALNQVIKGWTEGVQLMPVGSKFEFYIPSELAYGANGAGGAIGPNATLIFQVELLGIES
jgi:FKBP-type peptidyl-prolyl cis-trans isomerase